MLWVVGGAAGADLHDHTLQQSVSGMAFLTLSLLSLLKAILCDVMLCMRGWICWCRPALTALCSTHLLSLLVTLPALTVNRSVQGHRALTLLLDSLCSALQCWSAEAPDG
jgi:hypothetical protein